jgi:hypothetical protein
MLRMLAFAISFLANATTLSAAYASCGQAADIPAARSRWALVRQHNIGGKEDSCRTYSHVFLEAVQRRHITSICEDEPNRQRDLELLDADLDALNNLIAAQCG